MFVQLIIYIAAGLFLATDIKPILLSIGFTAIVTFISIAFAKRSLGGMSGDIAGYGIVFGELAGVFAMTIL